MAQSNWQPTWYNNEHATAWDKVKEAFRRDWEQTKHDLHARGHELNQGVGDTVKQAQGKEALPPIDKANPPKVIGNWDEVEVRRTTATRRASSTAPSTPPGPTSSRARSSPTGKRASAT